MFDKAYRPQERMARTGGFALLELRVVAFTVSLSMAILSPSLKSACDRAKRVVCGCRLK